MQSIHHTHVWSLDNDHHVLTAHIVVPKNTSQEDIIHIKEQLREFTKDMGFAHTTLEQIPLDPRRTELTHGEACVAMLTGILHQVFQLDNIRKFATDTDILQVILPKITSDASFDDRLGDTLDALYQDGLGNIELLLTRHMLSEFAIETEVCHNDTTTASV